MPGRGRDTPPVAKNPVDGYLAKVPEPHRSMLQALREQVLALVPDPVEVVKWGMPNIEQDGKGVVAFCAFKKHCSLFPMSGTLAASIPEVAEFVAGKGTLQFTVDKQLPPALVKKIVKYRLRENAERAALRETKRVVTELHKSGAVSGRGPEVGGRKHGKWRHFYANGNLQSVGAYRNGELQGKWEWYRADGTLMRTGSFKGGVQVGEWATYDRSGALVKTTVMKAVAN